MARGLERSKFGGDGLAQDEPARALDQHDHRRVGLRPVAGIDRRAVRGGQFRRVEDVLDADGKPAQRQQRALRLFGSLPCRVDAERGEGADVVLVRGDGLGAELDHGARSKGAGLDPAGKLERREHQYRPSISATIRSGSRRAGGRMRNAVIAAIGRARQTALTLVPDTGSPAEIEHGDDKRDDRHHHARHQRCRDQSGLGCHACDSPRRSCFLNHIASRGPAACGAAGSLKSR